MTSDSSSYGVHTTSNSIPYAAVSSSIDSTSGNETTMGTNSNASVVTKATVSCGTKRSSPSSAVEVLAPLNREGKNLSAKKLRRLEKNRISARECRRKKREAAQNLEREINLLESENLRLRLQLQVRTYHTILYYITTLVHLSILLHVIVYYDYYIHLERKEKKVFFFWSFSHFFTILLFFCFF